jgi:hypothetical protein
VKWYGAQLNGVESMIDFHNSMCQHSSIARAHREAEKLYGTLLSQRLYYMIKIADNEKQRRALANTVFGLGIEA